MAVPCVLCLVITLFGDGILRGAFDALSVVTGAGGFFLGLPLLGRELSAWLLSSAVAEC